MGVFLNPFKLYGDIKAMGKRHAAKGKIEGNYKGEGLVQGGVLVMGPAAAKGAGGGGGGGGDAEVTGMCGSCAGGFPPEHACI
jgi:hypothetical protein